MSIIQEALKKVEKSKVEQLQGTDNTNTEKTSRPVFLDPPVAVVRAGSSANRKNKVLPLFYILFLLIGILGIIKLFPKINFHLVAPIQDKAVVADPISFMKRSDDPNAHLADSPLFVAPYRVKGPSHTLSGIMFLDDGPRAILNNSIVREGEVVSGFTVKKINKKNVVLEKDGVEALIELQ